MVNGQFQGPVRPGTDVAVFRETGRSVPRRGGGGVFQGPVRPGRDEEIFRRTGQSVIQGSAQATQINQQFKAEQQRIADAQRQAGIRRQVEVQRKAQVQRQRDIAIASASRPSRTRRFISATKEFAVGETGKKFIGFGQKPIGFTTGRPQVTIKKTREVLERRGGIAGKTTSVLLMGVETPLGVAVTGGAIAIFPALPTFAQIGIGTGIAIIELPKAFDPSRLPEERIASGIIGSLAGVGTIAGAIPFIKGGIARLSPKFKPVKIQPEGFAAVVGVKGAERIGLIEPKAPLKIGKTIDVKLPKTSPLVRGGFGVKPSEKALFLGKEQIVATSQRGLFKVGKDIPLQKEFFVTPQEPFVKIPITRISRLGLVDPFKFTKKIEIGFGLPKQPQIGIIKTAVGRIETPTQFKIGKGTELEAIKTFGTIKDISKVGVTVIKGQAADIFTFKIGKGVKGIPSSIKSLTTEGATRVSGELIIGVTGIIKPLSTKTITKTISIPPTRLTIPIPSRPTRPPKITKTIPTRGTRRISIPISPPTTPTKRISPPISPPITPPITPPTTPTKRISTPISPPKIPSRITIPSFKGFKLPKRRTQRFEVLVRRFGKFKVVGIARTERRAFAIGRRFVRTTLAASFKVPKARTLKFPGFRTKKEDGGIIFIEPRERRLKRRGPEVLEIQQFKSLKGGR